MSEILAGWLSENYIELLGALLGLAYIILSVRQNILTWPTGLATSLLYAVVFFHAKFYAGMGLQIYYVGMSIYGWYYWRRGNRNDHSQQIPVRKLTLRQILHISLLTIPVFLAIFIILRNFTDSPVPFMDAFTTALSIIATWMLARKILYTWNLWIVADLCSTGLYLYKELWPTTILFLVYTGLAVYGYFSWKRTMSGQIT